ncbi:MAG: hypothetical protein NDI67_13545 [Sulfuritalea sp.]|nr:hypothetical protein [Sulfuritalea sp.]
MWRMVGHCRWVGKGVIIKPAATFSSCAGLCRHERRAGEALKDDSYTAILGQRFSAQVDRVKRYPLQSISSIAAAVARLMPAWAGE